jgi:hypothetical protein
VIVDNLVCADWVGMTTDGSPSGGDPEVDRRRFDGRPRVVRGSAWVRFDGQSDAPSRLLEGSSGFSHEALDGPGIFAAWS